MGLGADVAAFPTGPILSHKLQENGSFRELLGCLSGDEA